MTDNTYNGWTNRATWLVNVWGNPESKQDVINLRMDIEEQYYAMSEGILKDMIDLSEINWAELESSFEESEEDSEGEGE